MLKNKVYVSIEDVNTVALRDTGASVSVMSLSFKNHLGQKVMFAWDRNSTFRGVGGEMLRPVGVCSVLMTAGEQAFQTEFTVLALCTHDVILGIDFLRECGATLDCRAGEISLRTDVLLHAFEDTHSDRDEILPVFGNVFLPAETAVFVPVTSSRLCEGSCCGIIELNYANALKKNLVLPRSLASVVNGITYVWTVNVSSELVLLPAGSKLALFE